MKNLKLKAARAAMGLSQQALAGCAAFHGRPSWPSKKGITTPPSTCAGRFAGYWAKHWMSCSRRTIRESRRTKAPARMPPSSLLKLKAHLSQKGKVCFAFLYGLQLLAGQFLHAVRLGDLPDHPAGVPAARVPSGDIMGHHAPGANDHIVANGHPADDRHIAPDPTLLPMWMGSAFSAMVGSPSSPHISPSRSWASAGERPPSAKHWARSATLSPM